MEPLTPTEPLFPDANRVATLPATQAQTAAGPLQELDRRGSDDEQGQACGESLDAGGSRPSAAAAPASPDLNRNTEYLPGATSSSTFLPHHPSISTSPDAHIPQQPSIPLNEQLSALLSPVTQPQAQKHEASRQEDPSESQEAHTSVANANMSEIKEGDQGMCSCDCP